MKNYTDALHTTETVALPAGRYWVGDPCYAIREDWADFVGLIDATEVVNYKGQDVLVIETGGDGCWEHNGQDYGVDAGLLAVVPAALVEEYGNDKGVFVELTDDTEVGYITGGDTLHEVFAGDVTVTWREVEDEAIAEYAYENIDYTVITTKELFDALVAYMNDNDAEEGEVAEALEALPQFA